MEHRYEAIRPNILIMHAEHESDRPVLAAVTGSRRTLLMDAGNSAKHAGLFRDELKRRGLRQPDLLALTHWHWDHTFGMAEWNLPSIAHEGTADVLSDLAHTEWDEAGMAALVERGIISDQSVQHIRLEYTDGSPVRLAEPDIRFQESITIDLGGLTCELRHVGGDHSSDSCYLYVKEERVLFLGDALGPAVYGGPRKYTADSFLRLLKLAYDYEAEVYFESHGEPMTAEEFRKELHPWERMALISGRCGGDKETFIRLLAEDLELKELPRDLIEGVGYFMNGM